MTILRNVSFEDNIIIKALGGKWDGKKRHWFVPAGVDLKPFARWLPAHADIEDGHGLTPELIKREITRTRVELARVTASKKADDILTDLQDALCSHFSKPQSKGNQA